MLWNIISWGLTSNQRGTLKIRLRIYTTFYANIPSKMPLRASLYRKQASGRWSGRNSKRREVLSVNMISLPLADFRHISHIGNNADSFGDLSFLKMGHSLLLQSSQSEQNLLMACSPPPKPPRLNLDEDEGSESPDWRVGRQQAEPKKREKCNSMPLLDSEEENGEMEKEDPFQKGDKVASILMLKSGCSGPTSDNTKDSGDKTMGHQKDDEGGFSFSLDLGPSILDDVLQVMDKQQNLPWQWPHMLEYVQRMRGTQFASRTRRDGPMVK